MIHRKRIIIYHFFLFLFIPSTVTLEGNLSWEFIVVTRKFLFASTFIMDQSKGCIAAFQATFLKAFHLYCSFHCHQNINHNCTGSAEQAYYVKWMYNHFMNCKNVTKIQELCEKHYPHMKESDKAYLGSLPDEQQYPAARCTMDPNV